MAPLGERAEILIGPRVLEILSRMLGEFTSAERNLQSGFEVTERCGSYTLADGNKTKRAGGDASATGAARICVLPAFIFS